jgi:hypothetical protein
MGDVCCKCALKFFITQLALGSADNGTENRDFVTKTAILSQKRLALRLGSFGGFLCLNPRFGRLWVFVFEPTVRLLVGFCV